MLSGAADRCLPNSDLQPADRCSPNSNLQPADRHSPENGSFSPLGVPPPDPSVASCCLGKSCTGQTHLSKVIKTCSSCNGSFHAEDCGIGSFCRHCHEEHFCGLGSECEMREPRLGRCENELTIYSCGHCHGLFHDCCGHNSSGQFRCNRCIGKPQTNPEHPKRCGDCCAGHLCTCADKTVYFLSGGKHSESPVTCGVVCAGCEGEFHSSGFFMCGDQDPDDENYSPYCNMCTWEKLKPRVIPAEYRDAVPEPIDRENFFQVLEFLRQSYAGQISWDEAYDQMRNVLLGSLLPEELDAHYQRNGPVVPIDTRRPTARTVVKR